MSEKLTDKQNAILVKVGLGVTAVLIAVPLFFSFYINPKWNVWNQEQQGKAMLAKAEQSRQILVTQAKAEFDAAKLRAQAIQIIGEKAKEFPEYRQQEFIGAFAEALKDGHIKQIIYVPTEANIPIIERKGK